MEFKEAELTVLNFGKGNVICTSGKQNEKGETGYEDEI